MMTYIKNLRRAIGLLRRITKTSLNLIWKVARMSRWPEKVSRDPVGGTTCFVLGNGPSLYADIQELDFSRIGDAVCVSRFAETDIYEKIRPKYYVFADPAFWEAEASGKVVALRNNLFGQILRKTSWRLTIYIPFEAKELFESTFACSQNISLSFYNKVQLDGEKVIVNVFFDLGLGMPPIQNVLVAALFLSLRLGYKKIILLGADHSWHETLALDGANRVCHKDRHFYNREADLVPFTSDGTEEGIMFTMDTLFYALARMFEGYWKIEEYSKHLGAQIYNASSITYIDAFKRKPLAELLAELADDTRKDG